MSLRKMFKKKALTLSQATPHYLNKISETVSRIRNDETWAVFEFETHSLVCGLIYMSSIRYSEQTFVFVKCSTHFTDVDSITVVALE